MLLQSLVSNCLVLADYSANNSRINGLVFKQDENCHREIFRPCSCVDRGMELEDPDE